VIKDDGEITKSNAELSGEFLRFYQDLLGSAGNCEPIDVNVLRAGPIISEQQAEGLICSVSDQVIQDALFSIGEDKSPGPDGFSSGFFIKAWHIVGPLLCQAVREFFTSKSLLKQLNHTAIALVPKSSHSPSVADFRPISCCNVVYKIISKILASRMASVLDSIVDHAQAAFVKGRSLGDNVHLVQELLRKYNRKRISPRCLFKVDLRKAYDSLDWGFVKQVMEGLGFPMLFIEWVMECISSPSYSLIINGSLKGFFKGRKGLRQGDPISPYLFVICMEYLSRSLNSASCNEHFNYHPKCARLRISHLIFADDLILMARGDLISINILLDCLKDFGCKSGLKANVLKSNVFTAGLQGHDLESILNLSSFSRGSMPFRYLGIPLAAEKLRVNYYDPLIIKIANKISAWTASSLSYAGRAELIKTVLQGTECFWLSILHVPNAVIEKVYRMGRHFLWNSKSALVAWKEVCLPKKEGGLGFKNLYAWNSALLSKEIWNIHSKKDSLWVKWVNHEYFSVHSLWDRQEKKDDSPLLKKLQRIRDLLKVKMGSVHAAAEILAKWANGGNSYVSKAYDFLRTKGRTVRWAEDVWASCITPKHAFLLWLCAKGKIQTKDNLQFLDIDKSCILCGSHEESVRHLFFQCAMSRSVWEHIKMWLGISRHLNTVGSALKWIRGQARGASWQSKAKQIALAATIYHIWQARNRMIFEDLRACKDSIINRIKTFVYRIMFSMYPYVLIQFESIVMGQ